VFPERRYDLYIAIRQLGGQLNIWIVQHLVDERTRACLKPTTHHFSGNFRPAESEEVILEMRWCIACRRSKFDGRSDSIVQPQCLRASHMILEQNCIRIWCRCSSNRTHVWYIAVKVKLVPESNIGNMGIPVWGRLTRHSQYSIHWCWYVKVNRWWEH
jgi:hypothetical protein